MIYDISLILNIIVNILAVVATVFMQDTRLVRNFVVAGFAIKVSFQLWFPNIASTNTALNSTNDFIKTEDFQFFSGVSYLVIVCCRNSHIK